MPNSPEPEVLSQQPPDVVLVCDGQRLTAHKGILSRYSSYFEAMFTDNFVEKDQKYVDIKDVQPQYLQILVDVCYGHTLDLDMDLAVPLLIAADMLQFHQVRKACILFLSRIIDSSNCLSIASLGDQLNIPEMHEKAHTLALWHFETVVKSTEFLELPLPAKLAYLADKHLNCKEEFQVYAVVRDMIDEYIDEYAPEETYRQLFPVICFPRLSIDDLQTIRLSLTHVWAQRVIEAIICLRKDEFFEVCDCGCHKNRNEAKNCSHCRTSLQEPSNAHLSSTDDASCIPCIIPFCQQDKITDKLIHPESSGQSDNNSVERTTPEPSVASSKRVFTSQTVHFAQQLSTISPRSSPLSPCVVGHLVSTTDAKTLEPYVIAYKPRTRTLQPYLHLSKAFQGPVEATGYKVCSQGKFLFLVGGEYMLGYANWQNSIWRFDCFTNEWTFETNLQYPRRHHSVCVHENRIYVIGGFGKHRIIMDKVEVYDTETCQWSTCSALPTPLYGAACCVFQGVLFVFGPQVYMYHVATNSWSTGAATPPGVVFTQAHAASNTILLSGRDSRILYAYTPETFAGDSSTELFKPLGNFTCRVLNSCLIDEKLYVFSSDDDDDIAMEDKEVFLYVELYDVEERIFNVLHKESCQKQGIADFSPKNSLGCFPLVLFP